MIRGFKEKSGEWGYDNVYKGRLQNVREMLSKPKASRQDFTNEIATIHHVNVVRLMRYYVEETKRALLMTSCPTVQSISTSTSVKKEARC